MREVFRLRRWLVPAVAGLVLLAGLSNGADARAYKLHTLYSFCAQASCSDGSAPVGRLIRDGSGRLLGTTFYGGAYNQGTVFELSPAARGKWKFSVLYSFCALDSCTDGQYPSASVIVDTAGNVYGTTYRGGMHSVGTAFELTPNAKRTKWKIRVLHDFCSVGGTACTDGDYLVAGLTYAGAASGTPYDGTSPLYGTTYIGGQQNTGTIYSLAPVKRTWIETVLYSFCAQTKCADGGDPAIDLLMDASGNLFDTTTSGGPNNSGTILELRPGAHKNNWTETTLYNFCTLASCADGADAQNALAMDGSGNLIGTAYTGGSGALGVAYKLVPNGMASKESISYNFCSLTNCPDGSYPDSGLIIDSSGNLFGTTQYGGTANAGVVFKINGKEQVVYSFCALASCADGGNPRGGVIADGSGNLFGTTSTGGPNGNGGTIYELTP